MANSLPVAEGPDVGSVGGRLDSALPSDANETDRNHHVIPSIDELFRLDSQRCPLLPQDGHPLSHPVVAVQDRGIEFRRDQS